jgi:predicted branched-subunit amino acid permease
MTKLTPSRRAVVRDAVSVGLATGTYGVAFGAAGTAAHLSVWQTCALSLLVFSGGSQFALVGVLGGAGSIPIGSIPIGSVSAGVASALLLGARNSLYGVRLANLLRGGGRVRRLGQAQLVIDESTAMAIAQPTPEAAVLAFRTTGLAVFVFWNIATLLGAAGTAFVGDPAALGLDAAVPAAFLALLAPRLREGAAERWVAASGALIALAATPVLPPGVPVLLAALGVLGGLHTLRERT